MIKIRKHEYKFWMQSITKEGVLQDVAKSLEDDFEGLLYSRMTGLNDIGKPRIYTETYAEKSGIKAYVPDNVTNDSTKMSLTLFFVGDKRQDTFRRFNEYIRQGRHRYWDDARNLEFDFIVSSNIKVSTEEWYGGIPYIQAVYQLYNLDGQTKIHQ